MSDCQVKPFVSAGAAVSWAVSEIEGRVSGRAMRVGPPLPPGTYGNDSYTLALSICQIAGRHDVIDRHGDSCFYAWYIKEAPERCFSPWDLERLARARRALEAELEVEGIIPCLSKS